MDLRRAPRFNHQVRPKRALELGWTAAARYLHRRFTAWQLPDQLLFEEREDWHVVVPGQSSNEHPHANSSIDGSSAPGRRRGAMSVPTDPPHTPGQIFPVCLGASNKGTTGASEHSSQQPSASKRSRAEMAMHGCVDCSSDSDTDGNALQSSNKGMHLKDVPPASFSMSVDIHRPCGFSSGGRPNQCYVNGSIQAALVVPQFRSGISSIDTAQGVAKILLLQLKAVIRNIKGGRVFSPPVPRFPSDNQEDAWEYIASLFDKIPRYSQMFQGLHKIASVCTKFRCAGKSVQEDVPLPGYVLNVDILVNGNLRDALLTFKYQSGHDGDPNVTVSKCPGCDNTDAEMTRRFEMSELPDTLIIKANKFRQDEYGNRTKNNLRLTCPARLHEKDISNVLNRM